MNQVFALFLHKFVLIFFDDILVYNKTMVAYKDHLSLVLHCLQSNKFFFVKISKCLFC